MTGFSDPLAGKSSAVTTNVNMDDSGEDDNLLGVTPEEGGKHSHSEVSQAAANSISSKGVKELEGPGDIDGGEEIIPPGEGGEEGEGDLPVVQLPLVEPGKISTVVDLTVLLNALQLSEQKNQAEKTATEIKSESKQRSAESSKEIEQLQKKVKDMEKSGILKLFTKIFAAIGAILGIVAGALAIAGGVATGGNPLLVVGGVMAIVASIDALMSTLSDGKVSISAGITKALEAMGVGSDTAQWVAFAIQMAMIVATIAVGFASGGGSTVAAVSNLAAMISKSTKALQVVQSAVQATSSGLGIGKGTVESDIKSNEAKTLDIRGIMKKLEANMDVLQKFFEQVLSRLNESVDAAKDIVEEKTKTMAAIQRGAMS